jgi:hypothetical protein
LLAKKAEVRIKKEQSRKKRQSVERGSFFKAFEFEAG